MTTSKTFFANRKLAREFAKANGMKTTAVKDSGVLDVIGSRWYVNVETVKKVLTNTLQRSSKAGTIYTLSAGKRSNPNKVVQVRVKKSRKLAA